MRKFHGSRVGALRKHVYVCNGCRAWHDARARQCTCGRLDFQHFDSQAEARRYGDLLLLLSTKQISDLIIQHRLSLDVNGVKIATYVADFVYRDVRTGARVYEDVKGDADTHLSALKRKHAEAQYGIKINIVKG